MKLEEKQEELEGEKREGQEKLQEDRRCYGMRRRLRG